MKKIGVTGNMGCGKSTVLSLLSKYDDLLIIDCDSISKDLINSHKYDEKLIEILGNQIFSGDGSINLKQISSIIFSDKKIKSDLENFIHPLVWSVIEDKVASNSDKEFCIIESAIIFEMKNEKKFDYVITVVCSLLDQYERIAMRSKMSANEILDRLQSQYLSEYKELRSNYVVNTSCNLKKLNKRVDKLYESLKLL